MSLTMSLRIGRIAQKDFGHMAVERFSRRFRFSDEGSEITIRDDAPQAVREALLQIALSIELDPKQIRAILCKTLRKAPSAYNNLNPVILEEAEKLLYAAEWFQVYDFVEEIYRYAIERWQNVALKWQQEVNEYFQEAGVGWQLINGVLELRGSEGFEAAVHGGVEVLRETGHATASSELHEAVRDLSRRPEPDSTGAVQHGMAALECVAREVTGDSSATLGQIIDRFPALLPKPLDQAVEKAWGYASQRGRHISEGGVAERAEAELIVGLAASISTYLVRKAEESGGGR